MATVLWLCNSQLINVEILTNSPKDRWISQYVQGQGRGGGWMPRVSVCVCLAVSMCGVAARNSHPYPLRKKLRLKNLK